MNCSQNGRWVTVTDPSKLKPGDRVRYTDCPEQPPELWCGGDVNDPEDFRTVSRDGSRIVHGDGAPTTIGGGWTTADLVGCYALVQVWRPAVPVHVTPVHVTPVPAAPAPAFRFDPDKCVNVRLAASCNGRRADWAETAVLEFLCAAGESGGVDRDSVGDLLADLLHLCDREGLNAEKLLELAKNNWKYER